MKSPFPVLRGRQEIQVSLTRDSVCASDDCDAPHQKEIEVYSFTDPEALANATAYGYLPSVAGVGHRWICRLNGTKIAELSSSGTKSLIREATFAEKNEVHFTYVSADY
jgi:hypothetical protein